MDNADRLRTLLEGTRRFTRPEFPPGDLFDRLSADHFKDVIVWRERCGVVLRPSRWVSHDGKRSGFARLAGDPDSRHYAGNGQLADAGDYFPDGDWRRAWIHACHQFGGVGLYTDTERNRWQPGPMIHADGRGSMLRWVRTGGEYVYESSDPDGYWAVITEAMRRFP